MTQKVDGILWQAGCLTSNKSFEFGADPDHDPDPEIFNGIFATAGWSKCKNFSGSDALAEVYGLRVLLFIIFLLIIFHYTAR